MPNLDLSPSDVYVPTAVKRARKPRKKPVRPKASRPKPRKGLHMHVNTQTGDVTVRHMRASELAVAMADAAEPVWIQLAKTGDFAGHPAGPFRLDARVFGEIVKNFHDTSNKSIPIDFEHASESDPTSGSIPIDGAPAQGWIRDLRVDGGNLYGLVEWGDKAREYIRQGAYRYISPAIRFGAKDRVTGKTVGARLTSAGLTNQPFLDGMAPLAASDRDGAADDVAMSAFVAGPSAYMPAIRSALGLSSLAGAAECSDEFERLCDLHDLGGGEPVHGVPVPAYVDALQSALHAPLTMRVEELFEAVRSMLDEAMGEDPDEVSASDLPHEDQGSASMADRNGDKTMPPDDKDAKSTLLSETQTRVSELSLQLTETKKTLADRDAELLVLRDWKSKREDKDLADEVDAAFETYKDAKGLAEANKPDMLALCKAAPEAFRRMYPPVRASERHLLRNLTEVKRDEPAPAPLDAPRTVTVSLRDAAKQVARERGISLAKAQQIVASKFTGTGR